METVYFKRSDTLPKVILALADKAGTAIDLTSVSTVSFVFRQGATVRTRTGARETPHVDGKVSYTFVSGDWSGGSAFVPGTYELEVLLVYSNAARLTVPSSGTVRFVIEDDLTA